MSPGLNGGSRSRAAEACRGPRGLKESYLGPPESYRINVKTIESK
jgi:hypothetical protein